MTLNHLGVSSMSDTQNENTCPFDDPSIRTTEYAGNDVFAAIYNIAPVLPGHSLIVPRKHVERLGLLSEDETCRFFTFARKITEFLVAHLHAEGFDWTIQDGMSAGQTIGHVHLHVIPRWPGDLPSPGDWYRRLKLPITSSLNGGIDSEARPRLSETDLHKIVASLGAAATEAGISASAPPSGWTPGRRNPRRVSET
ncbi:MAG: HIT family protein [Gammaproteobacteria bacterium]